MSLIDFTGFEDGQIPSVGGWSGVGVLATSTLHTGSLKRTGGYSYNVGTSAAIGAVSGLARSLTGSEEHATLIVGGAIARGVTTAGGVLFHLLSDGGVTAHVTIDYTTAGAIEVRRGTGTGTLLGTSAAVLAAANTLYYVEAKVTLSDTVGLVEVKVDGVVVLSLTLQDTKNAGTKTVLDQAVWGRSANGGGHFWDDLYLCSGDATAPNDYLNAPRVYPMLPSGDGSASQFVGSDGNSLLNYQLVDERPPAFTDYVESATSGNRDLYATSDPAFAAADAVRGVRLFATVQNTDASTRNLKLGVKSGATVDMDAGQPIGTGATVVLTRLMKTNPVTAAAWTQSEVNALEVGVEVV